MNTEENPKKRKERPPLSEHTGRALGNLLGGVVASLFSFLLRSFIRKE